MTEIEKAYKQYNLQTGTLTANVNGIKRKTKDVLFIGCKGSKFIYLDKNVDVCEVEAEEIIKFDYVEEVIKESV